MSPLITARVLAIASVLACLAVLTTVAVHSSGLCQEPAWLFGCNDTPFEGLWRTARIRYRAIGCGALVLGALAWLAIGATLPRKAHRAGNAPGGFFGSGGAYATAIALGPVTALAAASRQTFTGALAAAAWCAVVAAVLIWWSLRLSTGRQRHAWFAAALVVATVLITGALATAMLWPSLFFVGAIVAIFAGNIAGAMTVYLFLSRSHAAAISRDEQVKTTAGTAHRSHWCAVLAAGLLAIGVAAAYAATPVPAPPADAVARTGPAPEAIPENTPKPQPLPAPGSQEQPVPSLPAAGLPPCGPATITVALTGWEFASGDSAATLVAHNVGQSACALRGHPSLHITQGGQDLNIRHRSLEAYRLPVTPPAHGLGLMPGERAEATVFWRGYRDAADPTTPQRVEVVLADGADPIPARIETDEGSSIGPAPFDVVAAAEIETGPWTPAQ